MMSHLQIRTASRDHARTRRFSSCHRHPTEPVTGFCALCLRDRLAGLDSSSGQLEVEKNVVCSRQSRGHAVASSSTAVPELRRIKSVAADKCDIVNGLVTDPRRKSCDVRARSSLSDLFVDDDTNKRRNSVSTVQSMNLGVSSIVEPVVEMHEDSDGNDEDIDDRDEIRASDEFFEQNEVEIEEEANLKTMKKMIEIELQDKRRNFWEAASVFSQKLRKWRQKQKEKKQNRSLNGEIDFNKSKLGQFGQQIRDTQSEVADYGLGRRSCDTEPRFSVDAHRFSVEEPRFSFDEHRASWDGYPIARTIPRLIPVNKIENKTENLQMHSISKDGVSSGGSGQSNSNSSRSNRGSTSSSSTKTVGLGIDDVKSVSNARVSPANDVIIQGTKLVITEQELKDWHSNSIKNSNTETVSNAPVLPSNTTVMNTSNGGKKVMSSSWKKVRNLWCHKHKNGGENHVESTLENGIENRNLSMNHVRKSNSLNLMLDRNRNTRYSTSDIDSGLLRLYLTPFRNSRRGKSGKNRLHNPSMAINGWQLK